MWWLVQAFSPRRWYSPAAVGVLQVSTAHGEHGASTVAALQKAGVDVVILLHAAVVGGGALVPQCPDGGEGTVVDDSLVVMLNDDVFQLVSLDVLAVDFFAGVFALPQGANIEIVIQNTLHGHNGPYRLYFPVVVLPAASLRSRSAIRGVEMPSSVR